MDSFPFQMCLLCIEGLIGRTLCECPPRHTRISYQSQCAWPVFLTNDTLLFGPLHFQGLLLLSTSSVSNPFRRRDLRSGTEGRGSIVPHCSVLM